MGSPNGYRNGGEAGHTARWFKGIELAANPSGLVACDNIAVALRIAAHLGGQDFAVGQKGEVAVRLVTNGPERVKFFLSDASVKLRRKVSRSD
jgi:hypothetical protein